MPNPVVFFEIAGKDGKRLQRFYAAVFGWQMDSSTVPGYAYVDTGAGGPPHGGIREEKDVPPDKVLYVRVPSIDAALELVKAGGGKVLLPRKVITGIVSFALFTDPEGNVMGLVE